VVAVGRHAVEACSSGGVDVRASTNGEGDTTKEQQQPQGLLASFRDRSSTSLAREDGDSAHVCAGQGGRAHGRKEGVSTDPVGKATTTTDPTRKTRYGQRDGGSSRDGRINVDPAGKAAAATEPTKATKQRGARQGGSSRAGACAGPDMGV
jgi:hypothetical protein